MQFPSAVEQWRATVAKYFPADQVDKALWVIQHESGGNAGAVGDGGAARGLFQIQDQRNFSNRPDAAYLDDPEKNIAYAAKELGAAGGNWGAWGEGTTYQGKPFGALGNNPFPGDTGGGSAGGGSGMTQPSGRNYSDPALDGHYETLKQGYLAAQKAWIAAGRPANGPTFDAMDNAFADLDDFTTSFGHPKSSTGQTDPAQQEFENRISIGDFETRQADSAFKKWFDKYGMARDEATQDYDQRADHNAANVKLQEARNTSANSDMLPYVTDAGYIEQSRSQLMDAYLKKMGISREAPTYQGAAGGGAGTTVNGPGGLATVGPDVGPGVDTARNPWDARIPFEPDWGAMTTPAADGMARGGVSDGSAGALNFNINNVTPADLANYRPPGDTRSDRRGGLLSSIGDYAGTAVGLTGIPGAGPGVAAAKGAGKKVKRWWQRRGYADGGQNIPAGPAWVGERGPEIMEVPGFGSKIVGQQGPEEMQIPEGANIIPVDEQFAMHQIQSAAREGPQRDRLKQSMEQRQRANDPQLQEKVIAAMQKGMASEWATNPPYTPMLEPGGRDYWAEKRLLTGIPASMEEAMMQQEAAKKGAR